MATRRQLLFLGGSALIWVGGFRAVPYLSSRLRGFEFAKLDRPPGFRTLTSGGGRTSSGGGFDFMVGLESADPLPQGLMDWVASAPTEALFYAPATGMTTVAYFFDYYCPYCRILSGHLSNLVAESEIALMHHHWPIFGEASELAARASLAAGMQGKASTLHRRLLQTPVRVTRPYLEELARSLDLSWSDLSRDMEASYVTSSLARTRALARLFAFFGTPALVIERTVVQGEISESRLRDLVQFERARGQI